MDEALKTSYMLTVHSTAREHTHIYTRIYIYIFIHSASNEQKTVIKRNNNAHLEEQNSLEAPTARHELQQGVCGCMRRWRCLPGRVD